MLYTLMIHVVIVPDKEGTDDFSIFVINETVYCKT
jgi:hypothetical protein